MQNIQISNDHGEYIMNRGTTRANQHAEKCVDSAWLPMRAFEKGYVGGAKVKFCDIAALMR